VIGCEEKRWVLVMWSSAGRLAAKGEETPRERDPNALSLLFICTQTHNGALKALWFYEEPSPTGEPFFHLRPHYRLFEELFKEMVL